MEQEMKIVTRQETFTDLAVRELGKSRAACVCRIQFKRCKKSECASCPQQEKLESCLEAMSDYDKLRLDSYTFDPLIDSSDVDEPQRICLAFHKIRIGNDRIHSSHPWGAVVFRMFVGERLCTEQLLVT